MTINFRPLPPQSRIDADTRKSLHARLKHEIEEERVSRELVEKHNERVRRSQIYRLTGELE